MPFEDVPDPAGPNEFKSPDTAISPENQVEEKKLDKVVIFLSTYYGNDEPSRVRSEQALKLLRNAEALGVHAVVAEGGSTNQAFLDALEEFPSVTVIRPKNTTMGPARRAALATAMAEYPDSYYLYCDPEKDSLITAENLEAMAGRLEDGADIVVPRRESMESYPPFQAWIEKRANKRMNQLMDSPGADEDREEDLDLWFGPKMFNDQGADSFLDYQSELDKWDAIIVPVKDAHEKGLNIADSVVQFKYPEDQRTNEEGSREFNQKRFEQYRKILKEAGDPFWKDK